MAEEKGITDICGARLWSMILSAIHFVNVNFYTVYLNTGREEKSGRFTWLFSNIF